MEKIESNYGRISNINKKRINSNNKKKLNRKNCALAITTSVMIFFAGLGIGKASEIKTNPNYPILNENQIMATITLNAYENDTIEEIANTYYNDAYENAFGSRANYEKSIEKQNNINNSETKLKNKINVPVIIDKNNSYLQELVILKTKISKIEQNNYWVKHTIGLDENLSSLAALSSGTNSETIENTKKIADKNGISANTIYAGQEIWIINPELGKLKIQLNNVEANLIESLKNDEKTK